MSLSSVKKGCRRTHTHTHVVRISSIPRKNPEGKSSLIPELCVTLKLFFDILGICAILLSITFLCKNVCCIRPLKLTDDPERDDDRLRRVRRGLALVPGRRGRNAEIFRYIGKFKLYMLLFY